RLKFGIVAAALVLPSVMAVRGLLEARADALPSHAELAPEFVKPPLLLPAVLLLGLVAFSSFVGEGAAGDWSAVYLRDSLHTSPGLAATALAAFSFTMAAGRFASDGLQARFGPVWLVRGRGIIALVV